MHVIFCFAAALHFSPLHHPRHAFARAKLPSPRMTTATEQPPKKCGLLVVGLAGNNGVTLLAGQLANERQLVWEGAQGPKQANVLGCITQVGSLARQYEFSSFANMAIGGWDVRPVPLELALSSVATSKKTPRVSESP